MALPRFNFKKVAELVDDGIGIVLIGGMAVGTVVTVGMAVTQIYTRVTQPDVSTPSQVASSMPSEASVSPEVVGTAIIIKQQADYLLGPSLMGPSMGKR